MTTDVPLTPEQIQLQESRAAKEGFVHRTLVAFDQFWNVATGGLPDETISSRAERDAIKGAFLGKLLTHGLDLIQKQHGEKAEAGDLERSLAVAATEQQALKG
jgi:hypothetical protein